ncbi:unnamed protein product [Diamesa serratosioi]
MTDIVDVPEWLKPNLFQEVFGSEVSVTIHSVKFACKKGENFASIMYRVCVGVENEDPVKCRSLMVKSMPLSSFSKEFMIQFKVFPKEIEMFQHIIPIFENMYKEIGHEIVFAPKCLMSTYTLTDVIIMEDLCEKHYQISQSKSGLDMEHMKVVLVKLAKFHAASAVHYERHGKYDEKFNRGLYNEDMHDIFNLHYDGTFKFLINEIFNTWGLDNTIIDKMNLWKDFIVEELIRTMRPVVDGFNVMCHGDMWSNNVMFCYTSDGSIDCCQFVDFQQSVYTSPAIDLLWFISTSTQLDEKLQNFEYYIAFYYENLVTSLNLLNYKKTPPTLKELQMDVLDRQFFGLMACLTTLPNSLVDGFEESSNESLLSPNEVGLNYKRKLYNNSKYATHMKVMFEYFNNRGVMDLC